MDLDSALNCALDADPETRRLGEHWLKLLESTPGSLLATIAFAIDKSKAQGQRQLAAIISQRLVKQFWSGRGGDESSGISPEDKRTISSLLLGGLKDPDSKLRTALGFTIALIVGHDTFDASRDLLLWLAAALKDEKDPNLIDGAVQCLQMVIEEISVDETLKALPLLCPPLVDVLQRPNCVHPDVGSASLAILSTLVETSCIRAAHQQAAKSHISAYIPLLMGIASTVLDEPVSPLVSPCNISVPLSQRVGLSISLILMADSTFIEFLVGVFAISGVVLRNLTFPVLAYFHQKMRSMDSLSEKLVLPERLRLC